MISDVPDPRDMSNEANHRCRLWTCFLSLAFTQILSNQLWPLVVSVKGTV